MIRNNQLSFLTKLGFTKLLLISSFSFATTIISHNDKGVWDDNGKRNPKGGWDTVWGNCIDKEIHQIFSNQTGFAGNFASDPAKISITNIISKGNDYYTFQGNFDGNNFDGGALISYNEDIVIPFFTRSIDLHLDFCSVNPELGKNPAHINKSYIFSMTYRDEQLQRTADERRRRQSIGLPNPYYKGR